MDTTPAQYRPMIRDMPCDERPRERLRLRGASGLTNAELLAILLRVGGKGENVVALASRMIVEVEGLTALGKTTFKELVSIKGVGEAKAAQILAAIELGKRLVTAAPDRRTTVRCSEDVYNLLGPEMIDLEQEHLRVVLLNARNQVMAVRPVYVGNAHTAVVRVSEVLREAVRENAPSLIVTHNHPSGDPSPSPDDVALTRQIYDAGRLLGIEVLDHVVLARGGWVSLKERGLGFPKEQAPLTARAAS